MKVDLNNPIIKHAQTSMLKETLKEQNKQNTMFKLLLIAHKKENPEIKKVHYFSTYAKLR